MAGVFTLQNVPEELEPALQAKARAQGKSVHDLAVEALAAAAGIVLNAGKKRDLSDIVGTWVEDPIFDEIREFHEKIDPGLWK